MKAKLVNEWDEERIHAVEFDVIEGIVQIDDRDVEQHRGYIVHVPLDTVTVNEAGEMVTAPRTPDELRALVTEELRALWQAHQAPPTEPQSSLGATSFLYSVEAEVIL